MQMIHKFQPFSTKKELGDEYNKHCELVPNPEDWILLLDYDAMILDSRAYELMEKAIAANPGIEIFSAYASRIGYKFQRIREQLNANDSFMDHYETSQILADSYPNGEIETIPTAAGFFLLFQKKYWLENKFQKYIIRPQFFDHKFCEAAAERKTVALIKGIYVWHTYRLIYERGHRTTKHLK